MKLPSVAMAVFAVSSFSASGYADQPKIIAISSTNGLYEDFATQTAGLLENGVPGNRLGGLGSGLTYIGGDLFLALPDRGATPSPSMPAPTTRSSTSIASTPST